MIALPTGTRVLLCNGVTDMRNGMPGLALFVQEGLGRDLHAGDLHVFRGRSGPIVEVLWHDEAGMSLYIKILERGRSAGNPSTGRIADPPHHLARTEGRLRGDLGGAAGLSPGRDRLKEPL
jgi:hypothetical protein